MVNFQMTLFNKTLSSDCMGTLACLLDVYGVCDVRCVTSVDPCDVLLK